MAREATLPVRSTAELLDVPRQAAKHFRDKPDISLRVAVTEGTCELDTTLVFGADIVIGRGSRLLLAGEGRSGPLLTSTTAVTGWFKPRDFPAGIPDIARPHLWAARVNFDFRVLYRAGCSVPRAASPWFLARNRYYGPKPTMAFRWNHRDEFEYPNGTIRTLAK